MDLLTQADVPLEDDVFIVDHCVESLRGRRVRKMTTSGCLWKLKRVKLSTLPRVNGDCLESDLYSPESCHMFKYKRRQKIIECVEMNFAGSCEVWGYVLGDRQRDPQLPRRSPITGVVWSEPWEKTTIWLYFENLGKVLLTIGVGKENLIIGGILGMIIS